MATVLVVDDSDTYRQVLRLVLELDDHRVLEAGSGEKAIGIAALELPDVAFIDGRLPRMQGVECVRALLAVSPATVVYGLTASDIPDELAALVDAGARSAYGKLDLSSAQLLALVD